MSDDKWLEGAEEVASNWMKFEKVGDRIKGTLVGKRFQEGQEGFSDQQVYEIKKEDGTTWNVGISVKKAGTVQRLNNCKMGEIVGVMFESEGEPAKKGFHPAKNLKVFNFGADPNYDEFEGGEAVSPELPEM